MLTRAIVIPLIAIVFTSAAYEAWIHIGVPPQAAEAQSVQQSPSVEIIPSPGAMPSFTYINHLLGLSLTYPSTFVRVSAGSPGWSYGADTKTGTTIFSVSLPPQSPFARDGGTGVLRIGIANDATNVADCTAARKTSAYEGREMIGGQTFAKFSSSSAGIESYRTLHNNVCYALETQITAPKGKAAPVDAEQAQAALIQIISTFNFI